MTVWITGNSHVGALELGLQQSAAGDRLFTIFPLGTGKGERRGFSQVVDGRIRMVWPPYSENLQRFTGRSDIGDEDVWGLCLGTHAARIYRAKFWANNEPGAIAVPSARPISTAMLDACIERDQGDTRTFIDQLVAAGIRCFVVACPPPRQDHVCFGYGTRRETVGYIHRRAYRLFADWLESRSVDLIDPPVDTMTEDGFLRSEFRNIRPSGEKQDRHHANAEYGRRMVRRIADHVRSRYPQDVAPAT